MMGQYEPSLLIFSEAIKIYEIKNLNTPEVAECWFNRGNTLLNIGKEGEALESFKKALEFEIDEKMQIKCLYAEGRAFESMHHHLEAITKFK